MLVRYENGWKSYRFIKNIFFKAGYGSVFCLYWLRKRFLFILVTEAFSVYTCYGSVFCLS